MNTNRSITPAIVITVLLLLAAYIAGLFIELTGDAGKYAAISRIMLDNGDPINLRIHGEAYDQKPPLLFWLSTLGFMIGGLNNWAFKIFPVLYSFAGIWFVFKLGESLYNRGTGRIAAIMLGTSWIYYMFAMDVHTDLVLQTNVTLALWQLSEYLKNRKPLNFVLAFVGIGLAMLTKGPIGGAVPAFALGTHLMLKRDLKTLFHPRWLIGIAIAMILCLPAFIGLYNQFGTAGLKFFFVTNNVGRITGSYVGNNNDYFFYFHTLLYLVLPWTVLFVFGFYKEIGSYFKTSWKDREYMTLGGIWIFFLIISIAKGKAPHYIFIIVPMMFVVAARWTNEFLNNERLIRRLTRAQNVINVLLVAFLLAVMTWLFPGKGWILWAVLILSLVTAVYAFKVAQTPFQKLFVPAAAIMGALMLYLNAQALPIAFDFQASNKAARLYNSEATDSEPIYNYLYDQYEIFFYSKDKDAKQLHSIDDFTPDGKNASWFFTNELGRDSIDQRFPHQIEKEFIIRSQGMNNMSPKFFNPKTRESALKNMYLLKVGPGGND